jgi:hypothetical protein
MPGLARASIRAPTTALTALTSPCARCPALGPQGSGNRFIPGSRLLSFDAQVQSDARLATTKRRIRNKVVSGVFRRSEEYRIGGVHDPGSHVP